jgi:hypothetical protein
LQQEFPLERFEHGSPKNKSASYLSLLGGIEAPTSVIDTPLLSLRLTSFLN